MQKRLRRREFLKLSGLAGGGLLVSGVMPLRRARVSAAALPDPHDPNDPRGATDRAIPLAYFIEIHRDGRIRFLLSKHEMGQGVATSLAMVLADELGANIGDVSVEFLTTAQARYTLGTTGGSKTLKDLWLPLRKAGALARQALIAAAAEEWRTSTAECSTVDGFVRCRTSGERLAFGPLAERAAARLESLPERLDSAELIKQQAPLKPARDFTLIGQPIGNLFAPAIVAGAHRYGADIQVEGMLFAAVARSPVFRGKLAGFDATRALRVPGVRKVVAIEGFVAPYGNMPEPASEWAIKDGVAVLAADTWSALRGRDALEIKWNDGANARFSSTSWLEYAANKCRESTAEPVRITGDKDALTAAGDALEATYVYPYQAHACMEPMNCIAHHRGDRCEVWLGTQSPQVIVQRASLMFNVPQRNIVVHPLPSGGGFGRRYYPDVALEALKISLAAGNVPVKVFWTREDDVHHDCFHPFYYATYRGKLDAAGRVMAWRHQEARACWGNLGKDAPWMAYDIPNTRYDFVDLHGDSPLQSGSWRSVVANNWAFGQECFIDELAALAGADPYRFRLRLLAGADEVDIGHSYKVDRKRLARVLTLAADKAGWTHAASGGRTGKGSGIAAFPYLHGNCYCALVVEVSVVEGRVKIDRVVAAVDCGRVVNPSGLRQQIEGGIIWGLSAALHGGIDIERGRVVNDNFDDCPVLRMHECPQIEVHFVDDPGDAPYGAGEVSPPVAAPALCNAIFAATGVRVRRLPIVERMPWTDSLLTGRRLGD